MQHSTKERIVADSINTHMNEILQALRQDPALPGRLAQPEADIVRRALAGENIHEIAQAHRIPEAAIWEVLGNAARAARGDSLERVETGGLGSDTDPGVTGGYGDTAFGSLGNEPPEPTPEEPESRNGKQ
jgi:hypothetical protein